MPMPGAVRYRSKGDPVRAGMLRHRAEMQEAGMPTSAALDSVPMPSYVKKRCCFS
jgi:hypothetical protein